MIVHYMAVFFGIPTIYFIMLLESHSYYDIINVPSISHTLCYKPRNISHILISPISLYVPTLYFLICPNIATSALAISRRS